MYQWARPRIAVPVHGERRHIREHVKLALRTANARGDRAEQWRSDPPRARAPVAVIDEVPAGRLYVDGSVIVPAEDDALQGSPPPRRPKARSTSSFAVERQKTRLSPGPNVTVRGLAMEDEEELRTRPGRAGGRRRRPHLTGSSTAMRDDDEAVEAALVRAVRKAAEKLWRKRPLVDVTVLRI